MAKAELVIKPPHMEVRMKPGFWPDLPKMLQTVKDAGYTPIPERTELRLTGKVVKQGERLVLELEGMKTPIVLPLVAAREDPDPAAHLERHTGQSVELEGRWQAPVDGPGAGSLAVTAVYDAGGKKGGK